MAEDPPGVAAWKANTNAFDRVRAVAANVSKPRTAGHIAREAAVSENTTRDHLERLVDMSVLVSSERGNATVYSPDPLHTWLKTIRELINTHSHDELIGLKEELQAQVDEWVEEYEVDSPKKLRARAATTETTEETRTIRKVANEWDLIEYRLNVVEDAIENYSSYEQGSPAPA